MKCIYCGEEWPAKRVPFSAVCENCSRWLHSCVQCSLWNEKTGMCRSMTTEPVHDREGKNFCEEWKPHEVKPLTTSTGPEKFNALFGDSE